MLRGATLDVTIVPGADDVRWIEAWDPARNESVGRLGGMVGDILHDIATQGGFTYRLYAIRSPPLDVYPGGWNQWIYDQVWRTDLMATWLMETLRWDETSDFSP